MRKKIITFLLCGVLLFCVGCRQSSRRDWQGYDNVDRFTYRIREQNNVDLILQDGREVEIQFGRESARVKEAYLYDDEQSIFEIICFIRAYASELGIEITRGKRELYGEYRLHTILYSVRYKRVRTKDADLDYTKDKRWYVNVFSKIIGWCGI